MELKFEKFGQEYVIPTTESLPAVSLAYLLNYGFQQSMQDRIAGAAKAVADEAQEKFLKEADGDKALAGEMYNEHVTNGQLAKDTQSYIDGLLQKRLAAIIDGTVGVRVGVQKDPLLVIAREVVRAAAKAKGVKVSNKTPDDGSDSQLDELAKALLANPEKRAVVEAEYNRRQAAVGDIDLGE